MSFILDALRKSESERRRDAVPDVTRIPLAPARHGAPGWVVPVTSVLSLAVLALAAAWWYSARPVPASTPADDTAAPSAAPARGAPSTSPAEAAAEQGRVREPRTRDVVPLRELAVASSRDARREPAREPDTAQPSTGRDDAADTEIAATLPRAADLRAEGVAVPDLSLELHVYSGTPANRFVFVNGGRYQEGDTLDSGQDVVRVVPEGVVLAHEGQRFLLRPD